MAVYTIESWLRGKVDFDIPESTIMAILFDNKVASGVPVIETSEMERDLCHADLLMWLSSSSATISGEKVSDGGWSHQKSAKQVVDRASLIKRAQALYAKWNSEKAKTAVGATVTVKSIY